MFLHTRQLYDFVINVLPFDREGRITQVARRNWRGESDDDDDCGSQREKIETCRRARQSRGAAAYVSPGRKAGEPGSGTGASPGGAAQPFSQTDGRVRRKHYFAKQSQEVTAAQQFADFALFKIGVFLHAFGPKNALTGSLEAFSARNAAGFKPAQPAAVQSSVLSVHSYS